MIPKGLEGVEKLDKEREELLANTEMCKSFMHLHLGIDAKDLSPTYICICFWVYICIYVCVYIYICIYLRTHIYVYKYTYINVFTFRHRCERSPF
jgi:hypothetical protein